MHKRGLAVKGAVGKPLSATTQFGWREFKYMLRNFGIITVPADEELGRASRTYPFEEGDERT